MNYSGQLIIDGVISIGYLSQMLSRWADDGKRIFAEVYKHILDWTPKKVAKD